MSELRNCPFCGSSDLKIDRMKAGMNPQRYGYKVMHFIKCEGCGAITSFRSNEEKETTVALWNGADSMTEAEAKRRQDALKRWQNVPEGMR